MLEEGEGRNEEEHQQRMNEEQIEGFKIHMTRSKMDELCRDIYESRIAASHRQLSELIVVFFVHLLSPCSSSSRCAGIAWLTCWWREGVARSTRCRRFCDPSSARRTEGGGGRGGGEGFSVGGGRGARRDHAAVGRARLLAALPSLAGLQLGVGGNSRAEKLRRTRRALGAPDVLVKVLEGERPLSRYLLADSQLLLISASDTTSSSVKCCCEE
eukprot:765913-Hanusia_phi.AAC.2